MGDTVTITTVEFNALMTAVNTGTDLMDRAYVEIVRLVTENAELKGKIIREWNAGYSLGYSQAQADADV